MCAARNNAIEPLTTSLNTTLAVEEIIADAIKKFRSDNFRSEESQLSPKYALPQFCGERLHHLTGTDVFKSSTGHLVTEESTSGLSISNKTSTAISENPSLISSASIEDKLEIVNGRKLNRKVIGNLDSAHNLTHSNYFGEPYHLPVQLNSTEIFHSVQKISFVDGDVQQKEYCSNHALRTFPARLKAKAYVSGASKNKKDKDKHSVKAQLPAYNIDLPYFLGNIVPGLATQFNLAINPSLDAKPDTVRSFLNRQPIELCTVTLQDQNERELQITITAPLHARGEVRVELEFCSGLILKMTALCILPLLKLPDLIVAPPGIPSEIRIKSLVPFTQPVRLQLHSSIMASKYATLMPHCDYLTLTITPNEGDSTFKLGILNEANKVISLKTRIETRFPQISLRYEEAKNTPVLILVVRNDESFPIEVSLKDDFGGLIYTQEVKVGKHEEAPVEVRRGYIRYNQTKPVIATFSVTLLSPTRIEQTITSCPVKLAPTGADLRPDIDCVVWLAEKELIFTMFHMDERDQRKPSSWKDVLRISACHRISDFVQITKERDDPTKVVLRISRPPRLAVGRLIFYRRKDGPRAFPYGFRYAILPPEKPFLIWDSASANATSRVYQLPPDGKVRVSNVGRCAVFVVISNEACDRGRIIAPGVTAILFLQRPSRIIYGLECWRSLVRYRTAPYYEGIQAEIASEDLPLGFEPQYLMADFYEESEESIVDKIIAEKIPDDFDTLLSLYRLFMSTVEEIHMKNCESDASTFVAPTSPVS
ncbi:uncharacterized protein LOC111254137 isoform X1 [Varroa destructor]|uniref:Uncharacterized protein n=1 Tax=Varroa destructor TaxID=109461 RepID=A0A7M7MJA6_VARDE|nr:uncharacterized protein LOC111254137 isoform X1 [Varroa destructor]